MITWRVLLKAIWWRVTFGPERELVREMRELTARTNALLQRLEREDAERKRQEAELAAAQRKHNAELDRHFRNPTRKVTW